MGAAHQLFNLQSCNMDYTKITDILDPFPLKSILGLFQDMK